MDALRAIRIHRGFTQESLANELGIDRSTVTKWETGESMPRAELLPKIAKVLNCTVDELLNSNRRKESN